MKPLIGGILAILTGLAVPRSGRAQVTCAESGPVLLDCNGNATDDVCDIAAFTSTDANANGIPDECDIQECFDVWSGFEPAPPFNVGAAIHAVDFNADGFAWDNPSGSWTVANAGCPASQGKALKGVAQTPPTADYVQSEYFHTQAGGLDCGAAIWSLRFDARSEALLNPRIDWQLRVRDGVTDTDVILLHWASTSSSFAGVTTAQGGNGRGRILVQNPAGAPTFINTGFAIAANTCYHIEITLDNLARSVSVAINGIPRVATVPLNPAAARVDYLRIQQVANGQASGGINRLAIDNVGRCQTGAALDWPDCNGNCISDFVDLAGGTSSDCNANQVPDECESPGDCNTNGIQDICDIAAGTSADCDGNGVPNECDPDCNTNGVPDGCDLAAGTSGDCNANGRLDACDPPADFNGDGLVSTADWAAFLIRFYGPETPSACASVDFDGDGDVDLADAAPLQARYCGPDSDGDRLADLYETDDGIFISAEATGTDPLLTDTDRDGIADGDEVLASLAGLDLPALGASPLRRDIFIEVDWTDDGFDVGPHSHRPTAEIISAIAEAFAASPTLNPYGGPEGVSLHVDYGQGAPFSGGNLIPGGPASISFGGQFPGLKAQHFTAGRKGFIHYAIFTHRYNSTSNNSSGVAEIFGDDFMVTLPFSPQDTSSVSKTMMHELGHNLNLRHGGDENLNQKPNYNSVMNYRYQFSGFDSTCDAWGDGVPDYSRGSLPTIDETVLNECNGICGPGFPIDWNFSGGACQSNVAFDVTTGEDGDSTLDVLHDFDDWTAIVPGIAAGGDRADQAEVVTCQEAPRQGP